MSRTRNSINTKRLESIVYGPHMGVSFAHIGFIMEANYVQEIRKKRCKEKLDELLDYYFYKPLDDYVAYKDLDPQKCLVNLKIKSIVGKVESKLLIDHYYDEPYMKFRNLELLSKIKIPNVENTFSISTSEVRRNGRESVQVMGSF